MPGRNIIKFFEPEAFYHVYNRGINKRRIFLDESDYRHFESLCARALSKNKSKDSKGRQFLWLREDVELVAYCLMPTHFHLVCYQVKETGVRSLLHSICTAYTMYFNKKYERRGPLFENIYRAVSILTDPQLQHISRYVHLNPVQFRTWPYSSLRDYLEPHVRDWIAPNKMKSLFADAQEYLEFLIDYEFLQRENDTLKHDQEEY